MLMARQLESTTNINGEEVILKGMYRVIAYVRPTQSKNYEGFIVMNELSYERVILTEQQIRMTIMSGAVYYNVRYTSNGSMELLDMTKDNLPTFTWDNLEVAENSSEPSLYILSRLYKKGSGQMLGYRTLSTFDLSIHDFELSKILGMMKHWDCSLVNAQIVKDRYGNEILIATKKDFTVINKTV